MIGGEKHIISAVFFPQTHSPSLVKGKHHTNPNRGAFHKMPDQSFSKVFFRARQGMSEKWPEKEVLTESQPPSRLGSTLFIILLRTVDWEFFRLP